MPFSLRNLKHDLEDVGSNFGGAPELEFRLATDALELEQSGLCYQRIPPGYRFPYGHTHKEQEEVYVVVRGSGRMKLDDEIVELREWDAVRVPPDGGFAVVDVPSREEALEWAAQIAVACRCAQEVREFVPDPTV
jgi:Cupin domain